LPFLVEVILTAALASDDLCLFWEEITMNAFHEREKVIGVVWGLTENACLLAYEREQ
jgi:hypothetical protein